MRKIDVIATGTGRCGTGMVARLLTTAGIETGHEDVFSYWGYLASLERLKVRLRVRGESSWLAAPWLYTAPLAEAFVIHLIRHPKQVMESWIREPTHLSPIYWHFFEKRFPEVAEYEYPLDRYAYRYVVWNHMIEYACEDRAHVRFDIARDPVELVEILHKQGLLDTVKPRDALYLNRKHNKHAQYQTVFHPNMLHDDGVRTMLQDIASDYGYQWPEAPLLTKSYVVKAVITTLDNCDVLKRQLDVLDKEPVDEIIIVNNGSHDGTMAWLNEQSGLTVIHRENTGAGPGRNAGLNAAECDGGYSHVLMLDGGVVPLHGGVEKMLDYLSPRPGLIGIGVEIPDMRIDEDEAWVRWPDWIERAYQNRCLSHTGYGLFYKDAFDGFRFCEEGPFGLPGWGADDNRMMYKWLEAGKVIHVVTCGCKLPFYKGKHVGGGVHPYRRKAGSWARIRRQTGLSPWEYGSVYEMRCIMNQQDYPQFDLGDQRGEPWLTVVVRAGEVEETSAMIKLAHKSLYARKLDKPLKGYPNPYSILLWMPDGTSDETVRWAEARRLCRHYGTAITVDGKVVRRSPENETTWTGDFRVSRRDDWQSDLRPGAFYFGCVHNVNETQRLLDRYNKLHPRRLKLRRKPPRLHEQIEVS